MELNKKNWLWRYYNLVYGEYPDNICSLSKGSIFIILTLPITLIGGFIDNNRWKSYSSKTSNFFRAFFAGFLPYIVYILLLAFGLSPYLSYCGLSEKPILEVFKILGNFKLFVWMPLLGAGMLLAIAIFAAILAGTCFGIKWIYEKITEKADISHIKVPYIQNSKDFIAAIKGKYCTQITWK